MTPCLLQINYTFRGSRADFEREFAPLATDLAQVPGLRWKIWLMDESQSRGGGIYLFDDETSLQNYLAGPIVAALQAHPGFSDLSAQPFAILAGPTQITRGPISAA